MFSKTLAFDIDGVICKTSNSDYENSIPNEKAIKKINNLYNKGHKIIIFTARFMGRTDDNISKAYEIGFDFTKNVWDENLAMSNEDDVWSGNIAISHLIFDDTEKFNNRFGNKFSIIHQKFFECFIFLNSGGVTSKTFYIPLNYFFLNIINFFDNILTKIFPNFFAMGRQIVLKKI